MLHFAEYVNQLESWIAMHNTDRMSCHTRHHFTDILTELTKHNRLVNLPICPHALFFVLCLMVNIDNVLGTG